MTTEAEREAQEEPETSIELYHNVPNNVFNNPGEYTIKHPLCDKWTLHFDDPALLKQNPSPLDWKENVKELCTFETVEDFWRVVKNLKTVTSKEIQGSNLHFFKTGIAPEWEDPANERGGKWVLTHDIISDKLWEMTMLLCVSGQFGEFQKNVCGIVAATRIRRKSKLSLWTNTCDRSICMAIGKIWKETARIAGTIHFQPHVNAKRSRQSYSSNHSFKL